ncbi:tail assembly chaperone [Streptococcus suis]
MILKIGGREYTLRFGLGFLREMNKLHSAELEGMKTGYGAMTLFNAGQALNDPMAFVDIIKAGTVTEPQKPSNEAIEAYLEELITNEIYDKTIKEVVDELKKSPLLKKAMNLVE